jgi:FemAB-related protein (PEP-CTERM system-associated)
MEIRHTNPDDSRIWDDYVERHPQGTPYQRFAWVESVEQAYQHKNVSLIAIENQQVVGVLPCVKMQKPFSKASYCSLPFCDLGFCLADSNTVKAAMLDMATQLLKNDGGTSFEYRDSQITANDNQFHGKKVRMILPLPDTSENLMAGFKSKLRSQIRKAEKNGLTYAVDNSQQHIDDFYQIFSINMRKLGSPVHSKKWFESLFSHYQNNIFLSVVYTNTTPIGAGIVLRNTNKVSIPWASTVAEHNKLAPNMMLYWSLLKHVCDLGCTEFDFGRSTYDEGTYKFKRQWGAEPLPLQWSNLAAPQQQDKPEIQAHPSQVRALVENIWSKLPLGVTTSIGPKIRKHISL